MARSLKKGPYVFPRLLAKVQEMNKNGKKEVVKTWSRRSTIFPDFVGHTFVQYIDKFIPYIALALLAFLGIKMIIDFFKNKNKPQEEITHQKIGLKVILIQGVATSIDALSTGLTFADYKIIEAIICVLIIGVVTFAICLAGIYIGKKSKVLVAKYADLVGGIILLLIGIEIFVTGLIGL